MIFVSFMPVLLLFALWRLIAILRARRDTQS
jgi:hypothetical protein